MQKSDLLSHEETLFIESALSKEDGVISFPTDTVYGLGCLPENIKAVERIYSLKNRSQQKPLILLGSSFEALEKYVKYVPENIKQLMNKYWPGPLTIVLPQSRYVPEFINFNQDSIGIRIPDHPVILEVLKRCTHTNVLATTSANISNQPDLTTYEEVKTNLGDKVDYIIQNYNHSVKGTPSTVITINQDNSLRVLRQGTVVID